MKIARIFIKTVCLFFFLLSIIVFASLIYVNNNVSSYYNVNTGEVLEIDSLVPVRVSYSSNENKLVSSTAVSGNTFKMDLKVLGIVPVKQISVKVVDQMQVAVLGSPFGIKIYTEGVLVVGFTEVDTENGDKNPAKTAGLKEGDFIVSLNGVKVYTNEDVLEIIKNSNGEPVVAEIISSGKSKTISFYPSMSKSSGTYRAGVWVKDSSAGIGTLTFYSPTYNVVAGLGHGICDSDTGTLLSLNSGEFVTANIVSYKRSSSGEAGELSGVFSGKKIADFNINCENGVYGNLSCDIVLNNLMSVALKQEVRNGKGYILTTIDGNQPDYYACNVKIRNQGEIQNLLVEITDERLLNSTGGILQGMSGSPIIQNGKLIGAVTHVLVDNPKKGYGIFAETMLESAEGVGQGLAPADKLKDAS